MPVQKRLTIAVIALAVIVTAVAARYGSRSAGGADSYGYISQADVWLTGDFLRPLPFLVDENQRPPMTRWVFVPLGWLPATTAGALVPFYAPGYPLILAVFKLAFGHAAMFWVVPLMAGALVWGTYFLGCRLGRSGAGAVAALLVASSATMLFMAMSAMSDVPTAALWTFALALVLGHTRRSAFAGGVLSAVAILVRPNLLPLAGLMGVWLLANDVRLRLRQGFGGQVRGDGFGGQVRGAGFGRQVWRGRALPFGVAAACGAIAVAVINNWWYGSPTQSGYGPLDALFSAAHLRENLANYPRWLMQAETPLAVVGLLVVLVAPGFVSRRRDVRGTPALLWTIVAWVWGMTLFYLVFDTWWFMRFLLPSWPIMAIGSASLLGWLWQRQSYWRVVAVAIVVAAVSGSVWFARGHEVFRIGLAGSRYPQVARAVASLTDPMSGILAMQHSGSVRYYGGRMTLRWDVLRPDEIGPLIAWLRDRGHHPYLLVDADELARLHARYPGEPALVAATWPPLATFFNNETMLFDLDAIGPSRPTALGAYTRRAIEPVAPPRWRQ